MHSIKLHALNVVRCALKTTRYLLCAGIVAGSMMAASAEEFKLSKKVCVAFDAYGAIDNITSSQSMLAGKGCLVAQKEKQKSMLQIWGSVLHNKVKCEMGNDEMTAQGTLTQRDDVNTAQVEFKVRYKKIDEGVLSIRVEATPLEEADWVDPTYYGLMLPVSAYSGAAMTFEASNGEEKTFVVGSGSMDMLTYGSRKATVVNGKQKIIFTPAKGSQISATDCRRWGENFIRIECRVGRAWKPIQQIGGGQNDEFEFTITFKDEK